MAKTVELIYDVREGLSAYSDDSEYSNEYIVYLYGIKRAKYLRQDLNNYQRSRDNSILQTLCLGLEEVTVDECSIDLTCEKILRTKSPLPIPLELHSKVAITKVKPTNRIAIPFNFISKDKVPFLQGATFKNGIYAFLDNDNYIYVVSPTDSYKLLECITITGVFEDPLSLANYSNCCNCEEDSSSCFDELESEYPLQPHYIDLIRKEIISDLLEVKNVQEDKTNDSNDI